MANQSQNSDEPSLCANNCGFFRNSATNNLCSKCYKDFLMKQTRQLRSSLTSNSMESKVDEQINKARAKIDGEGLQTQAEKAAIESTSSSCSGGPKRCSFCRKQVGKVTDRDQDASEDRRCSQDRSGALGSKQEHSGRLQSDWVSSEEIRSSAEDSGEIQSNLGCCGTFLKDGECGGSLRNMAAYFGRFQNREESRCL